MVFYYSFQPFILFKQATCKLTQVGLSQWSVTVALIGNVVNIQGYF